MEASGARSRYREWPFPEAGRAARCRWEQRVEGAGAALVQRVLPDGCADVVVIDGADAVVTGPASRAALPVLPPGTVVVGLRVGTEAIRAVFGVPGGELRDRTVGLDELFGRSSADRLIEALHTDGSAYRWLVARLMIADAAIDGRVRAAVGRLWGSGGVDVTAVAGDVGLSARQLRRILVAETGMGPKTLQRIGRLQRFLRLAEAPLPGPGPARPARPARPGLAVCAARAGYADQAHLAKDVNELAATTPARLLAERLGGAA